MKDISPKKGKKKQQKRETSKCWDAQVVSTTTFFVESVLEFFTVKRLDERLKILK